MENIGNICSLDVIEKKSKEKFRLTGEAEQCIIEGVQELDTLCPVSKVTGHRGNPLQLLRTALSDSAARLLDAVLQEIPTVKDLPVSDDEKLSMCVQRLYTGSLAEQDALTRELSQYVDTLFPDKPEVAEQVKESIQFESSDKEVIDKV